MRKPAAYLKVFVGLGLLFATAIFVSIGFFAVGGTFFTVVAEFFQPPEGAGVASFLGPILIIGGLCCIWLAVKLFRANNPQEADLRCFLGGCACLFAGTTSILFGMAYLVPDAEAEGIGGLPFIAAGLCWLVAMVMLFRGHRAPVSQLGRFFFGNAMLVTSLIVFSISYDYYFEKSRYIPASIGVLLGMGWLCSGAAHLLFKKRG